MAAACIPRSQNTQFSRLSTVSQSTPLLCQSRRPKEPAEQKARGTETIHARDIHARRTKSRTATGGHVATVESRTGLVLATALGRGTATIEGATGVDPGTVSETGSGMDVVYGIEIGASVGIDMVVGEVRTEHFPLSCFSCLRSLLRSWTIRSTGSFAVASSQWGSFSVAVSRPELQIRFPRSFTGRGPIAARRSSTEREKGPSPKRGRRPGRCNGRPGQPG